MGFKSGHWTSHDGKGPVPSELPPGSQHFQEQLVSSCGDEEVKYADWAAAGPISDGDETADRAEVESLSC